MAQLYPQALGSLFVVSYASQGYGGGIRPRLHTGFGFEVPTAVTTCMWSSVFWEITPCGSTKSIDVSEEHNED
jgi:hypothetical protein